MASGMGHLIALSMFAAPAPLPAAPVGQGAGQTCAAPFGDCGAAAEGPVQLLQLARSAARALSFQEFHTGEAGSGCGDPSWYWGTPADCAAAAAGADDYHNGRNAYNPPKKACQTSADHPWCDSKKDAKARASELVMEMNWTELAQQVSCDLFGGVPGVKRLGVNAYNYIRENNHGVLWNDVCPQPTLYPQVVSLAASFNRTLWRAAGENAGKEARWMYDYGKQNSLFLQSNFNIFLDPRWGRGQEVPGEDPHLNTEYAKSWVQGVQAPKGPGGVPLAASSCKHFAAYSMEGGGGYPDPITDSNRHNFDAEITKQDLADTHFPMFEACAKVGALGMMTSYNAINGVPMAAHSRFTNELARDTWGFEGAVVTDCGAVGDMWIRHKYVPNATAAARAALQGGTDIECGSTVAESATPDMLPLLQESVKNIFAMRARLGEFDAPPADSPQQQPAESPPIYDQAAHAKLSYEAAVQGSVLLKNDDGLLPLAAGTRVALMGPMRNASWEVLGNYAGYKDSGNWADSPNVVSPAAGMISCATGSVLTIAKGGPYVCSPTDQVVAAQNKDSERPKADVVVIMAGLLCQDQTFQDVDRRPEQSGFCQAGCLETEGCDRPGIDLPQGQQQLIQRALGWGLPVVVVLMSGGPVDLSPWKNDDGVKSIMWMGYPGQAAGTALARMLYGFDSPGGRLTQSFYSTEYVAKLPITTMDVRPDATTGYPGRGHRFVDPTWVVYKFGYGLSYFQWSYAWAEASASGAQAASEQGWSPCHLSFTVTSTGGPPGLLPSASVLLFLEPPAAHRAGDASAPKRVLAHFDRVEGAASEVSFVLAKSDFQLADGEGEWKFVPGTWQAVIGEPAELSKSVVVQASGCSAGSA